MRILVTGAAGFIGFFVSQRLLARGDSVIGLDNFNPYYDPALKHARADVLQREGAFTMVSADIADAAALRAAFEQHQPTHVIHLAAQAGVRHSLTHPQDYVHSNLVGTANILECCRQHRVQHLTYASTSSVYGLNRRVPFSTCEPADHPTQFYAATKRATELMAHSYSNLFGLPTTGLRFFTVYGPWGRPDMALFLFTRNILAGKAIPVFNHGHHTRDFTYVEDIAEGVVRTNDRPAASDAAFNPEQPSAHRSSAPWRIYNIGGGQPIPLTRYIEVLEECLGRKAQMELLPMQPGDLPDTKADADDLVRELAFCPSTPIEVGVPRFVEWYRAYHGGGDQTTRGV
jgi:UDP-glucuronate 4-epimerase